MVKVFEYVKISHYVSFDNGKRHGLRNNEDELNIYHLFLRITVKRKLLFPFVRVLKKIILKVPYFPFGGIYRLA